MAAEDTVSTARKRHVSLVKADQEIADRGEDTNVHISG